MLNEWSDRLPERPLSLSGRIRRGVGYSVWGMFGLVAGGALLWQVGGTLLRLGIAIVR